MEKIISDMAQKIKELDTRRSELAEELAKHPELKTTVDKAELDGLKVCGVDGGFLKKEYHGASLIIRRAVGVCFEYYKGKLDDTQYFPNKQPVPEPIIVDPNLSDKEFNQYANLKRTEIELKVTLGCIEKFNPDVMVVDGSITLHPSSKPEKDSRVYQKYLTILDLFNQLYSVCAEKNILLVGAVEDSRSRKFCDFIIDKTVPFKEIMDSTNDSLLLHYLLKTGERTTHILYSGELNNVYSMYLKAAEYDRPLRLDFFANQNEEKVASTIAAIIMAISSHNKTYAYPSVLIEADARAKLSEIEIEHFKNSLTEKLGKTPSMFELRRELRPF